MRFVPKLVGSIGMVLILVVHGGVATAQEGARGDAEPKPFLIRTTPPVPGFRVSIDGEVVTTDANGEARFMLATRERIRDRVRAIDDEIVDGNVRYRFSKIQRFAGGEATAVFNVDYLVDFRFRGPDGAEVAPDAIDRFTIKSSTGQVSDFGAGEPIWMQGLRVLANNEPREIYWTVQDVVINGASVVNRAQQRVTPAVENQMDVDLLLFDVEVVIRSGLMGREQGGTVVLRHPDGRETRHDVAGGAVSLLALPRGDYTMAAEGPGLALERPVAVSRNQTVELKIWTWGELAMIATLLGVFLAIPVLLGRRRRRRRAKPTLTRESLLNKVDS